MKIRMSLTGPVAKPLDQVPKEIPRPWPDEDDLDRLLECENGWVHILDPKDPGEGRWVKQKCSMAWCSRCERLRSLRLVREIDRHLSYYGNLNWHFVTMSGRNSPTLESAFERDRQNWQKFRETVAKHRAKKVSHVWHEVATWVGFREVTYSPVTGFHVHRHFFVGTAKPWWDWRAMHLAWDAACGEPSQFHEKQMSSMAGAVRYAAKYAASKAVYWGGLTQLQAYRFGPGLKGKNRLIRAIGSSPPEGFGWVDSVLSVPWNRLHF